MAGDATGECPYCGSRMHAVDYPGDTRHKWFECYRHGLLSMGVFLYRPAGGYGHPRKELGTWGGLLKTDDERPETECNFDGSVGAGVAAGG